MDVIKLGLDTGFFYGRGNNEEPPFSGEWITLQNGVMIQTIQENIKIALYLISLRTYIFLKYPYASGFLFIGGLKFGTDQ